MHEPTPTWPVKPAQASVPTQQSTPMVQGIGDGDCDGVADGVCVGVLEESAMSAKRMIAVPEGSFSALFSPSPRNSSMACNTASGC